MSLSSVKPLAPEQLARQFRAEEFTFNTTDDIPSFRGILGQERAVEALQFGVAMPRSGYNVFVMGYAGTGRFSYVKRYLENEAKRKDTPSDWLYVNNFTDAREPFVVKLPSGKGSAFCRDIDQLLTNILATFPAVFETPTWQQKKSAIDREFNRKYDSVLDFIEKKALEKSVALYRDSSSISFTPMFEGKALDEADFAQLEEDVREKFHADIAELEELLNQKLSLLPQWKRESSNKLRQLNEETIAQALEPLLAPLAKSYSDFPEVLAYLQAMQGNLLKTVVDQLVTEDSNEPTRRQLLELQYSPNLMVGYNATAGAPVIFEPHPTYDNLFGRIEYVSDQSGLSTNFRQLRAGALHRANGGYLVLEAEKLLTEPFVWDALKRALHSRQIKMESPLLELGRFAAVTLSPQVIPLQVKVIIIGEPNFYYALQEYDADFQELFRVLVDFDSEVEIDQDSLEHFAQLMKTRISEEGMAPLSACAIAALARYSARLAEHQQRLSACISDVFQVVSEADFIRLQVADEVTQATHIERAIRAREYRTGRISQQIQNDILAGTILIDSQGEAVGKCNGLTVLSIGDSAFGAPARISATVYPGNNGIVDIEREASLGQSIHSKGVMILTGFLGSKYAQKYPLDISASIALEQSYGYIDGDSASLGEGCALISAIAKVPLKQCFAITGSINQFGEVQAIGGVNEKIEGFFKLCKARGLTGEQGVIIPHSNIVNLMLSSEVLEAVQQGQFNVYSVRCVDDALEVLTGLNAGKLDEQGNFPEDSINARVVKRLQEISELGKDQEEALEEALKAVMKQDE